MKPISRRNALKRLAAGGLLTQMPAVAAAGNLPDPLVERLAGVFSYRASAAEVGRRYLALGLEAANSRLLAARVAGSARTYRRLRAADSDRLRALLARQQRRDFAAGRTVSVDGWVLSLTEARLCAIAALAQRG